MESGQENRLGVGRIVLEPICILVFHPTAEVTRAEAVTGLLTCVSFPFSYVENFPTCRCQLAWTNTLQHSAELCDRRAVPADSGEHLMKAKRTRSQHNSGI